MAWTVSLDPRAVAELRKLDRIAQKRIVTYLRTKVISTGRPRDYGKAMVGGPIKLWRYRIGDYRVICNIDDDAESVRVLRIGHRKEVYR